MVSGQVCGGTFESTWVDDLLMAVRCAACGQPPPASWEHRLVSPPFTCSRCGAVSHNPSDREQGYCGRCHDWTGPASPIPDAIAAALAAVLPTFTTTGRCECGEVVGRDPRAVRVHTARVHLAPALVAAIRGLGDEDWAVLTWAAPCCNELAHGPLSQAPAYHREQR